jgi:hypothetical protein
MSTVDELLDNLSRIGAVLEDLYYRPAVPLGDLAALKIDPLPATLAAKLSCFFRIEL